ncbi:hypothetical protein ACE939_03150 [Aquimarina sp. W85]|uniref:hypothetical protein n=1 Tax=Aquimarina rhodophyticola TaxID=3342246 RepID=UPI00366FB0BD
MKKVLLIVLILIGLVFISSQYYKNYEKKERYKTDIINDLANRYKHIELKESKVINKTVKDLQSIVPSALLQEKKDSISIYAEQLNSFNIHLQSNIHYYIINENNDLWESAKVSGVLSQFDKDELAAISKAYLTAERLNTLKMKIQTLPYTYFFDVENTFPNATQLKSTYSLYYSLLLQEENALYAHSSACKSVVEMLDAENAIVKETDSLKQSL